jgi:hypothetical protein
MSLPGKPIIRNAPRASPNTLEYYWFPPADTGGNPIEGYQLSLNPGGITCNVSASQLAPTYGYYKITGLTNATTYFTTIAASTINGYGPPANFRRFQPGSPPLFPPSTTTIVVSGQSNAVLSWTPPLVSPDATIFWYVIKSKSSNPSDPILKYTANGQTQSNFFIRGLNSNSTYYFTINAVNCPGYSPQLSTATITFITNTAFAPTMAAGLTAWFDASNTNSVVISGSGVVRWNDATSNGRYLSTASVSGTPQYTTYNSLPAVQFDGVDDFLPGNFILSDILTTTQKTMFFVGLAVTVNTDSGNPYENDSFIGDTNGWVGLYLKSTNKVGAYNWPGSANSVEVPYTIGSFSLFGYQQNNTILGVNLNGNTPATTTTGGTGNMTNQVTFGRTYNVNTFLNGYIMESIIYNQSLTPFNQQKVEGYLAWKWRLQTQLPTIHPFRSSAPQSNSVFSPPQFSTLRFWYDAQDSDTIIRTGNSVTQWNDKSSNALHMRRVGLSTITYISSAVNNYPAIYCSSAGLSTLATNLSPSNQLTYFMVLNQTQPSPAVNSGLFESAAEYRHLLLFTRGGGNNNVTLVLGDANERGTGSNIAGLNTLLGFTTNGSTAASLFVNGNTASNFTPGTAYPLSVSQPYRLAASAWAGNICEVMAYSNALSTPDRQTVEGYLAWKWGLQGNLPTTHPYRYNNPGIVNFTQLNPTSFGGLGLWLDASQLTGLTNGGSLTTWVDRSSNAYIGTASNGPTFITNSINGLPVVRFNGTNQLINFGSNILNISTNTGLAVFSVVKFNNASSGGIIGKTIYGPGEGRWALTRDTVTGLGMNAQFFIQSGGTATESIYADTTTTTQLIEGTWDRQIQYIYQNGLQRGSNAKATMSSFNTTYPLYAGAYPDGAGSAPQYYMSGDIAEILVYMANITPFIRQQIEGYLSWKWGLQASLPSTHPYFTAPPQQAYTSFTPTLYSGLQLWLDATQVTGYTNGQGMTSWIDKSANNFSNNASNAPTYQTNALNGQPVVRFNGTTQFFNFGNVLNLELNGISVFSVANLNTTGVYSLIAKSIYNAGLARWGLIRNGTENFFTTNTTNGATVYNTTFTDTSSGSRIFGGTWDRANLFTYSNATQVATVAGADIGYGTNTYSLYVGAYGNANGTGPQTSGPNLMFNGDIGEILVYNRALSTSERQTVEGYLAWKWGLQGRLPVTHPYALINPGNPSATPTVTETGLLIRFDATTYSGSDAWSNAGTLGSGYDATVEAGTPSKNTVGNGVVFNGSTNYKFPNISAGNAWSASVWAKRTGTNQTSACYLTQTGPGGGNINLSIFTNDSGAGVATNQVSGGFYLSAGGWKITTAYTLNQNIWYYLQYTWDGTTLNFYVNGILTAFLTPSATPINNTNEYRIGRIWSGTSYIVGEVGQVLIYNRALTATEVLQNYAATSNTFSV